MAGTLYMIPTTLGESSVERVIPNDVLKLIPNIKYFIVEDVRTARRYLKKVERSINIDELTFFVLDKRTKPSEMSIFLNPIAKGHDVGIISEAGCPGVADPGADIAKLAHEKKIKVVPLVGPSSILLALMASGMNGQSFSFNGYLAIKKGDKLKEIKFYESLAQKNRQAQIFIETPFRNQALLDDLISACSPQTRLCIACDITLETEYIVTKTIGQWKAGSKPELHKRPAIFIIQ